MLNYNKFIEELYNYQDLKYRDFHKKIICSDNLIGIRTPILKKIASSLAKDNYKDFIKYNNHNLYEETMIHGFLIGYIKTDYNEYIKLIDDYIKYINNWAICDMTVANLKFIKKYKDEFYKEVIRYINSDNMWSNRFGYVILLDYYIDDKYIDNIFNLCKNYKDEYYVKMSIAWLISMCYIKYKDKTLKYLNNCSLDDWTYNKTIQKIIESNRISKEEKLELKQLKR